MQNKKLFILILFLCLSLSAIFLYEPNLKPLSSTKKKAYQASLLNISMTLDNALYWQGNISAQNADFKEKDLIFQTIKATLEKEGKILIVTANHGSWSPKTDLLSLTGDIIINNGSSKLQADDLTFDFRNGLCRSSSPISWRHGQILASSPALEEKMTAIQEAFGIHHEFSD